jgi:hypothetical protein
MNMADHVHRVVECSLCGQVTTDCGCDPSSINRGDRIQREVRPMPCCQPTPSLPPVRGPIICDAYGSNIKPVFASLPENWPWSEAN